LRLALGPLVQTAEALLDPYRRRRWLLSLEEVLDDPGDARTVFRQEEDPRPDLSWIPARVAPPQDPTEWQWGIRPAQRVLHLELDILRRALKRAEEPARVEVLAALVTVDDAVERLEILRGRSALDPKFRRDLKKLVSARAFTELIDRLN